MNFEKYINHDYSNDIIYNQNTGYDMYIKELLINNKNKLKETFIVSNFAMEQAEKLAKGQAEKLAKEAAEKLAKEAAEKLAKETAEKLAKEQAEKLAKEQAKKNIKLLGKGALATGTLATGTFIAADKGLLGTNLQEKTEGIKEKINDKINDVKDTIENTYENIKDKAENSFNGIKDKLENIFSFEKIFGIEFNTFLILLFIFILVIISYKLGSLKIGLATGVLIGLFYAIKKNITNNK